MAVGMGKTMVCISLILANPYTSSTLALDKIGTPVCGATLIMTSVSLIGQWLDELSKFAPSLKVVDRPSSARQCRDADVILTTTAASIDFLFEDSDSRISPLPIFRTIIDESHLIPRPGTKTHMKLLMTLRTTNLWLVTGTPISRSYDDLKGGAYLLGHWTTGLKLSQFRTADASAIGGTVAALQRLMIRHTMEQRIGGQAALSLPEADVETVLLDMSADERAMYERAVRYEEGKGTIRDYRIKGARASSLEFTIALRRATCSNVYVKQASEPSINGTLITVKGHRTAATLGPSRDLHPHDEVLKLCVRNESSTSRNKWSTITSRNKYIADADRCTKLKALRADLEELRRQDPSMHAVVFTHCTGAHSAIVQALKARRFDICQFTGSNSAAQRHESIRNFQSTMAADVQSTTAGKTAKVFVVTMKTGSVGITLTAATRCYLFEPAFDPATEAQAAGRIRRLGQTKGVMVKRFVFRNSLDEHICNLHKAVRQGSVKLVDGIIPPAGIEILAPDVGT